MKTASTNIYLQELLRVANDVYLPLEDKLSKAEKIIETALSDSETKLLALEAFLERLIEGVEEKWG